MLRNYHFLQIEVVFSDSFFTLDYFTQGIKKSHRSKNFVIYSDSNMNFCIIVQKVKNKIHFER